MSKLIPLFILCFFYLTPVTANQVSGGAALVVNGSASDTRVLTVTGKGFAQRLIFEAYDTARFEPYDDNGRVLPDGIYAYELTSYPTQPAVQRSKKSFSDMQFDSILNRKKNRKRGTVTAGTFRISGGSIVPFIRPNQIEGAVQ